MSPVNATRVFALFRGTYDEPAGGLRYSVPKGFYRVRPAPDEASYWVECGTDTFAEIHLFFYDNPHAQSVAEFARGNIQKGTANLATSLADVKHISSTEFVTRDHRHGMKAVWKCVPELDAPYYRIIYYIDVPPASFLAIGAKMYGGRTPRFESTLDRMAKSMRRMDSAPENADTDITPLYGANLGNAKDVWQIAQTYWQDGNERLGIRYLTMAATQGLADAQYALGVQYFNGRGVSQDTALAIAWYERAANQKNVNALVALGYCYRQGLGVAEDSDKAKAYFAAAAALGDIRARRELDTLALSEKAPSPSGTGATSAQPQGRGQPHRFTNPFPSRPGVKGIGFDPRPNTLRKGNP